MLGEEVIEGDHVGGVLARLKNSVTFTNSSVKFIDLKNSIKFIEFFKQYILPLFTLIYPF